LNKTFAVVRLALILSVLAFAGVARASTIEFTPSSSDPNGGGTANTGAYGSTANVSVGYSPYVYAYASGYGGLDGGTGAAIYSDNYSPNIFAMTFTAAAGYTVTLDSFNLAQYTTSMDSVDITVTGGSSTYMLTDTPAGGTGNFSIYSPDETGTSLTLTITNLYAVGLNTIVFSETAAVPEPSSAVLAALGGGISLLGVALRRRKRTA
jgi:hypothetical protein